MLHPPTIPTASIGEIFTPRAVAALPDGWLVLVELRIIIGVYQPAERLLAEERCDARAGRSLWRLGAFFIDMIAGSMSAYGDGPALRLAEGA